MGSSLNSSMNTNSFITRKSTAPLLIRLVNTTPSTTTPSTTSFIQTIPYTHTHDGVTHTHGEIELEPEPEPEPEPEGPKETMTKVKISYKLQNLEMTDISVKDKEDIIENIKALYANAVNISTNNVSVVIEDGSTIFRIVINLQGSIVSNTNNISYLRTTIDNFKDFILNIVRVNLKRFYFRTKCNRIR